MEKIISEMKTQETKKINIWDKALRKTEGEKKTIKKKWSGRNGASLILVSGDMYLVIKQKRKFSDFQKSQEQQLFFEGRELYLRKRQIWKGF